MFLQRFYLFAIFWIYVKHSTFTSWSCSFCSRMFSLSGIRLSSTFLLFFISSRKLMISYFSLIFSDTVSKSFSFNTVMLWEIAWVKEAEAVAIVTWSSSIFSNSTSSSYISSKVPSLVSPFELFSDWLPSSRGWKWRHQIFTRYYNWKDDLLLEPQNTFQRKLFLWWVNNGLLPYASEVEHHV